MIGNRLVLLFLFALMPLILYGCGSNSAVPMSTLQASQSCIGCHSSAVSPVTGDAIVAEWEHSTHNTKNGAGCADCHEPDPGHPTSCSTCHNGGTPGGQGHDVTVNAVAAGKCEKCHTRGNRLSFANMTTVYRWHFNNVTTAGIAKYPASYAGAVNSASFADCRNCRNPHDPTSRIPFNKQWAASGHGNTKANARVAYDFKTRGTYLPVATTFEDTCVRCHTTTGFINYVVSGFADQRPFAGPGYPVVRYPTLSTDKSKELTMCNACHDDGQGNAYSFALRAVPQVRVYYNYSSPTKTGPTVKINNTPFYYPDTGQSNICLSCHVGRVIGQLINMAAAMSLNFGNISRPTAHHAVGGATLFKTNGYEYGGRDYTNPSSFVHDRIGQGNFANTGSRGPCLACHMNSDLSHSYLPVTFKNHSTGVINGIVSRTCSSCHNDSYVAGWTVTSLQQKRNGFTAALASLSAMLVKDGLTGTSTNWLKFGTGTGPNTMGAYFNYDMLNNDSGAYAHNDIYVKRLIYDSIDWLNDGAMDNDTEAAINSLVTAGKITADTGTAAIRYIQGTSTNSSGQGGTRP